MARCGSLYGDSKPRTDYRLVSENDELKRRIVALERKMGEQQRINEQLFKIVGNNSFMSFKFNDEPSRGENKPLGGNDFVEGTGAWSRKVTSSRRMKSYSNIGFDRF